MASTEKSSSNTPLLGLNTTSDPSILKPEELTYALNAKSENPFYSNYEGNKLFNEFKLLKPGYSIIGDCLLNNDDTCIFAVNPSDTDETGSYNSEIGILSKSGTYSTKVNNYCLNFSISSQIQAKYKTNVFGERVVYWCDNHRNSMRNLNLDNIPTLDDNITFDCSAINVFRNYKIPLIDLNQVSSNGALVAGGYEFSMQYADANSNPLTPFIPATNVIPIYKDSISDPYKYINGDDAGTQTGKSIELNITNLDTNFDYYNLVVIRTIKGIQTSEIIATLPTGQTKYIYTGAGTIIREVSLSDLVLKRVTYKSASTVTEANGFLLWGDLQGNPEFNLQPYINNIQVQWNAQEKLAYDTLQSFKNPENTFSNKLYMRDEVYPLGLEFDLIDGTTTNVYTIPGRSKNKDSLGNSITRTTDQYGKVTTPGAWDVNINDSDTINDLIDTSEQFNLERWKVYNTAYQSGTDSEGLYGEMSYWESDTNTYPNKPEIWGNLAGKPIRHHKFPDNSIVPIHDGIGDTTRNQDYVPKLYYLGIRLTNIDQVINSIPSDIRSKIQGWRLVRGDRTFNKSIIAKGVISNMRELDFRFATDVIGPSDLTDIRVYQNYPFNDLRPDPFIATGDNRTDAFGSHLQVPTDPDQSAYRKDMFSFFSPDTTFVKSYLNVNELKIESEEFGQAYAWYDLNGEVARFVNVESSGTGNIDRTFCNYSAYGNFNAYKTPPKGNIRRKVRESIYVPYNSEISTNAGRPVRNNYRESTVFINTVKTIADPTVQDTSRYGLGQDQAARDTIDNGGRYRGRQVSISMYEVSLKSDIAGQYGSIFDITYVDTGYNSKNSGMNKAIFGGDVFLTYFNIKRSLPFFGSGLNRFLGDGINTEDVDLRANRPIPSIKFEYYRNGDADRGYYGYGSLNNNQMGYIPCVASGALGFWVETEVNTDLRSEGQGDFDTYYPNLKAGAVAEAKFLGVESAQHDNYYNYNTDYSTKNNLYQFDPISPNYDPNQTKLNDFYNKVIFSQKSQSEEFYDNWLVYKALDYYDFPKSKGRLIDMRYIGQSRIIFRFEEALYLHAIYGALQTSAGEVLLGNGALFQRDPQEVSYSEVGSIGTRSQWAFNSNKAGQFMIDDIRGKIYLYSDRINDISAIDMQLWFNENLPLNLPDQFSVPTDNPANFNGIGFVSTYDHSNDIWLLTKKDYKLIDDNLITTGRITYNNSKFYLDNIEVSLTNNLIFENKSWTIGYSIRNQKWISWYSFLPSYYLNSKLTYFSGINTPQGTNIYQHLKGDYNTYYDILYPYIIEMSSVSNGALSSNTSSIEFTSQALLKKDRQTIYEDKFTTFNKAIVYNDEECSGLLNLSIQDENNLESLITSIPVNINNELVVPLRKRDRNFKVSEFYDIVDQRELAISFFNNNPINQDYITSYPIDKVLDNSILNYNKQWYEQKPFKGRYTKIRLILDTTGKYQLITNFVLSNQRLSVR